jgi:hypothetical protein
MLYQHNVILLLGVSVSTNISLFERTQQFRVGETQL